MSFSAFFPSYHTVCYYVCVNSFAIHFFMLHSLFYIFRLPMAGRPSCNTQPLVQTAVPEGSNNLRDCKFFGNDASKSSNNWFKCCCCFTFGIALGQLRNSKINKKLNFYVWKLILCKYFLSIIEHYILLIIPNWKLWLSFPEKKILLIVSCVKRWEKHFPETNQGNWYIKYCMFICMLLYKIYKLNIWNISY